MINETYKAMLKGKSIIRELSEYATARGKEIGYENVFDYSLGNPSVPCAKSYTDTVIDMYENMNPMDIHGYSPSLGIESVREPVADSLNRRFDMDYEAKHIFMASGAAGALAHALRGVTKPGDEVLTFAPCFPEYFPYVNTTGAQLKVVPANTTNFQINFHEFKKALNPKVMAVLINTPNNPSGAVYSEDTIKELASILVEKQEEYGHGIYLITDEPYRELVYDDIKVPYLLNYYDNTLVGYSFSKSLSLPGERIGYIVVSNKMKNAGDVYAAVCGAGRALGYVCAPSLFQRVAARCIGQTADVSVYKKNRDLLYQGLTQYGYKCVRPDGAFYLFVKAMEEDANAFCERAKKYELLLVPGDDFGCPGYVRISYCVTTEQIECALPAFEKLSKEYHS